MIWRISHRADPAALPLADRHYNRQKIGSPQFVPPGRCLVLLTECERALWVTSWPFAAYVRHAWPGAWVNSLFRNDGAGRSSDLIRDAVAATRAFFGDPPALGMVTFVNPLFTQSPNPGYCYQCAGFVRRGYTAGRLPALQMMPNAMPDPEPARGMQPDLFPHRDRLLAMAPELREGAET